MTCINAWVSAGSRVITVVPQKRKAGTMRFYERVVQAAAPFGACPAEVVRSSNAAAPVPEAGHRPTCASIDCEMGVPSPSRRCPGHISIFLAIRALCRTRWRFKMNACRPRRIKDLRHQPAECRTPLVVIEAPAASRLDDREAAAQMHWSSPRRSLVERTARSVQFACLGLHRSKL